MRRQVPHSIGGVGVQPRNVQFLRARGWLRSCVVRPSLLTCLLQLFPGLIYRLVKPKVVLLIFVSGKVVLTGRLRGHTTTGRSADHSRRVLRCQVPRRDLRSLRGHLPSPLRVPQGMIAREVPTPKLKKIRHQHTPHSHSYHRHIHSTALTTSTASHPPSSPADTKLSPLPLEVPPPPLPSSSFDRKGTNSHKA